MRPNPRAGVKKIVEGSAELFVPAQSFSDPFHCKVFFNPAMRFNRSVSSLALQASINFLNAKTAVVVDGLCSLGARGIRYAKENSGVKKVFFVDANQDALPLLKKNVKTNKLEKKSVVVWDDLNRFFANSEDYFDFIEIDPFGSPVFFLENAVRRLKKKAVLSVTATDLANLCGARASPCIKHYQAKPLNNEFCHENALRILVGKIVRVCNQYDFGVTPLLSFYRRHYAKAFLLCEKGAAKADEDTKNFGFILYCPNCLWRASSKRIPESCPECKSKPDYAGPLWSWKSQDTGFLDVVSGLNAGREYEDKQEIGKMLSLLREEDTFPPWFYDLHFVAGKSGLPSPSTETVVKKLLKKGFKVARTHFCPTGIKADAGIDDLREALCGGKKV